ncbi:MAG TPA: hypothetical protein VG326_03500 [Tepidisphaeraceae bacterium]|jgi:hypothetical protein|nr:hypothetical protein [Tepidisphaeraceae bacterium]
MDAIRAIVRNGRIETMVPLKFPEGTELLVVRSADAEVANENYDNTPEAITAWLKWYDSLEPLIFTAEEREARQEDRKARTEWELAHSDDRAEKLRRLWE